MSSKVKPIVSSVQGGHEMTSSLSVYATANPSLVEESIPDEENARKQRLESIDKIFSIVLKLMKLFGMYSGNTSLKRLTSASGRSKKQVFLEWIYCCVVVSGLWLNFIMAFFDIFFGNNFFLFVQFSLWCLVVALSGTICLIVLHLPFADTRESRFEKFLRGVLEIKSYVKLEKVKKKSQNGIIIFCVLLIVTLAGILGSELVFGSGISDIVPWNRWFGFKILSLVFQGFGCGTFLLPIHFLYITCLILEELFDELHRRMSLLHSFNLNLAAFKREHRKLCEVVELTDKVLAPLLFVMVSGYIPLICLIFFHVVMTPFQGNAIFLITNLSWLLMIGGIFSIIMLFGSKLNDKIHSLQKILDTLTVVKEDEGKLVMLMLSLQGDTKGLSIGGLAVITKSTSLTIVGVIISYFAVMLSLPK